jgi:hypothetical protein
LAKDLQESGVVRQDLFAGLNKEDINDDDDDVPPAVLFQRMCDLTMPVQIANPFASNVTNLARKCGQVGHHLRLSGYCKASPHPYPSAMLDSIGIGAVL